MRESSDPPQRRFFRCDADELATLERLKSCRTYPAGTLLATADATLNHFSSVIEGCATTSRTLEDGRRQTVGLLLLPSDFIGRPGRDRSAYDVESLTEVKVCRFRRVEFETLVFNTPHIANRLLRMTLDELDAARDWAVVLGRLTAREGGGFPCQPRPPSWHCPRLQPRKDGRVIHLPLSREAMADHLGLTIETTSRQISALRRDGVIESLSNCDIRVPDFGRLALEAGEDEDGGLIV